MVKCKMKGGKLLEELTKTEIKYLRVLATNDVAIDQRHLNALVDAGYSVGYEQQCLNKKVQLLRKLEREVI